MLLAPQRQGPSRLGCPGERVSCSQGQKVDESHGMRSPAGEPFRVSGCAGRGAGSQKCAGQTKQCGNREELCASAFYCRFAVAGERL